MSLSLHLVLRPFRRSTSDRRTNAVSSRWVDQVPAPPIPKSPLPSPRWRSVASTSPKMEAMAVSPRREADDGLFTKKNFRGPKVCRKFWQPVDFSVIQGPGRIFFTSGNSRHFQLKIKKMAIPGWAPVRGHRPTFKNLRFWRSAAKIHLFTDPKKGRVARMASTLADRNTSCLIMSRKLSSPRGNTAATYLLVYLTQMVGVDLPRIPWSVGNPPIKNKSTTYQLAENASHPGQTGHSELQPATDKNISEYSCWLGYNFCRLNGSEYLLYLHH